MQFKLFCSLFSEATKTYDNNKTKFSESASVNIINMELNTAQRLLLGFVLKKTGA